MNFDGELDIVSKTPPTGRVQISTVFLFDKALGDYKKNEELSSLPCLEVNSESKTISGTCFSSNACDHWAEHYKFANGSLRLFIRNGTYCNPITGEAYKYSENYEDVKLIESHTEEIPNK